MLISELIKLGFWYGIHLNCKRVAVCVCVFVYMSQYECVWTRHKTAERWRLTLDDGCIAHSQSSECVLKCALRTNGSVKFKHTNNNNHHFFPSPFIVVVIIVVSIAAVLFIHNSVCGCVICASCVSIFHLMTFIVYENPWRKSITMVIFVFVVVIYMPSCHRWLANSFENA